MFRIRLFALVLAVAALLVTAAPTLAAPTSVASCSQYYRVQPGDNLFRIGLRFGTNYFSLMTLNGIGNPRFIYVGQTLCVKSGGKPTPMPGGMTDHKDKHDDPNYTGYDTPKGFEYCVKPGDTLSGIALKYGWSLSALINANRSRLRNPNLLYIDTYVLIPHH